MVLIRYSQLIRSVIQSADTALHLVIPWKNHWLIFSIQTICWDGVARGYSNSSDCIGQTTLHGVCNEANWNLFLKSSPHAVIPVI